MNIDPDWRGEHLIRTPRAPQPVAAEPPVAHITRPAKRQALQTIITALVARGMSQREISEATGFSRVRVSQVAKALGVTCRPDRCRVPRDDLVAQITALAATGMSQPAIAKAIGYSRPWVSHITTAHNIPFTRKRYCR